MWSLSDLKCVRGVDWKSIAIDSLIFLDNILQRNEIVFYIFCFLDVDGFFSFRVSMNTLYGYSREIMNQKDRACMAFETNYYEFNNNHGRNKT